MGISDEIKARCNIVDVIGRCVNLKKSGSNYKGVCPFHNEKTPSFVVSESKQIFNCFGCGEKGDVISFVEKYYNLSFQEAIEKLATEYNIELKNTNFHNEKRNDKYYEINARAAKFFFEQIKKESNPAYKYIRNRGISDETIVKFGMGYAPDSWDEFIMEMKKFSIEPDDLLKLGLASEGKRGVYSKFRNRLMFPIINTRGKVIGFGGRVLDDGVPKYLNSPESDVFKKKNNLFAINLTRREIGNENAVILVEGYMDVISLYQNGVKNVVASLGTALTPNQAMMIKRYTNNVIIAYDSDSAGKAATMRAIEILSAESIKVRVLSLSQGKDPDEFIKKHGKERFIAEVSDAMTATSFKMAMLREKYNIKTEEGLINFINEAVPELKKLSPVESELEIKKLVRETGISEGTLVRQVLNTSEINKDEMLPVRDYEQDKAGKKEKKFSQYEGYFIKLMVLRPDFMGKIKVYDFIFKNPAPINIYQIAVRLYEEFDREIDLGKLRDSLDDETLGIFDEIMESIVISGNESDVFEQCIMAIEKINFEKRQKDIIKTLAILDETKDKEEVDRLTLELLEIQRIIHRGE